MKLETKNLVLRTVTLEDLPEVARTWNFGAGEISLEEAEKAVNWMTKNHEQNKLHQVFHICFAIFEKDNDRIIGWCGLDGRNVTNNPANPVNLFYLIDKEYRRRGYATECALKVLEYGFGMMELDRIEGECARDNLGSQKVLEKIRMRKATGENEANNDSLHYYMTLQDYKSPVISKKVK